MDLDLAFLTPWRLWLCSLSGRGPPSPVRIPSLSGDQGRCPVLFGHVCDENLPCGLEIPKSIFRILVTLDKWFGSEDFLLSVQICST